MTIKLNIIWKVIWAINFAFLILINLAWWIAGFLSWLMDFKDSFWAFGFLTVVPISFAVFFADLFAVTTFKELRARGTLVSKIVSLIMFTISLSLIIIVISDI